MCILWRSCGDTNAYFMTPGRQSFARSIVPYDERYSTRDDILKVVVVCKDTVVFRSIIIMTTILFLNKTANSGDSYRPHSNK